MKNTQLIKRFKFGGFRLDIDKPINGFFGTKVVNKVCYCPRGEMGQTDEESEITGHPAKKDYFFYFARTNNCNGLSGWTLLIWKLKFYLIYGEENESL